MTFADNIAAIVELRAELNEAINYAQFRKGDAAPQNITDIWEQIERLNKNMKDLLKIVVLLKNG